MASENGIAAIAQAALHVSRSQDMDTISGTATRPTERALVKMMVQVRLLYIHFSRSQAHLPEGPAL